MHLNMTYPPIDFPRPVSASATFDPPVVRPGQSSFYRVTFNALEQSIEWPEKIPSTPALEFRPGAHGQVLQYTAGGMAPLAGLNFRAHPAGAGEFTVPQFVVHG